MRLYIPTSSLNADNILSCESIAPASECRRRKFGYSHFDVLPELRTFANVTLAFSKIPTFSVNDSDRECFAMVVAIDIEDLGKYQIQAIGTFADTDIFATANPISISPSTTQLLFFNERAKSYTLHSCSDSAKCKLFDFYKSRFGIVDWDACGKTLHSYLEDLKLPALGTSYYENDFDAAKGFIWGYGIGALLSIPQDIAKLLQIQKRIYDIVSSTKNEGFMPTALSDELSRLDTEYSSVDPSQKAIRTAWTEYLQPFIKQYLTTREGNNIPVSNIDAFLKAINAETSAKKTFLASRGYKLRKKLAEYMTYGKSGYEYYSRDIESYTQQSLDRHRKQSESIQFASELDTDTDKYKTVMMSASDRNAILFNKIVSRVIWDRIIPSVEELRVNKAEVAKSVVIELKKIIEEMGEQWADAPVQMYFNSMRNNITRYTEFNFKEIDDPVLQSIAAFLLKGEEFDALKQYLETNAFPEYRYAFALWGALNGYVSIPRAVSENNLNIHELSSVINQTQESLQQPGLSKLPEQPSCVLPQEPDLVPAVDTSFRERVLATFDSCRKTKNTDLLRKGLVETLDKLESSGALEDGYILVTTLDNKPGWDKKPKPAAWEHLKKAFCPDYEEQRAGRRIYSHTVKPDTSRQSSKPVELDLFSPDMYEDRPVSNMANNDNWVNRGINSIKHILGVKSEGQSEKRHIVNMFINDERAIDFVDSIPNISKDLRRNLITNICHIQRQYQPNGFYGKRKDSTDNADVIDHLIRWCVSEKNRYTRIDKTDYNLRTLEQLKQLLLKYYCGNR